MASAIAIVLIPVRCGLKPCQLGMSAAARARIGAAKKAWWAKQKRKTASTKSKPRIVKRRPMSPAMRKKLSAMMKARWAERKKAA